MDDFTTKILLETMLMDSLQKSLETMGEKQSYATVYLVMPVASQSTKKVK